MLVCGILRFSVFRGNWGELWDWGENPLNFFESGLWGRILSAMKTLLTVLFCLSLPLIGADKKPLTKEESAKVIEAAIRKATKKPAGELNKDDYEKVTKLIIHDVRLTDVKGLENLMQLTRLSLKRNQLTNVKGLENLTQLTELYLGSNKLTDVMGLEKLTKLTGLSLSINNLTDVKSLERLTQLKHLNLNYNKLTDVKGLEKLTKLEALNLQRNPDLTKAQIVALQKALPKCKISY